MEATSKAGVFARFWQWPGCNETARSALTMRVLIMDLNIEYGRRRCGLEMPSFVKNG
jgi:hypothetical protein